MKIARFSVDGWESYGRVEGDRVRVIQGDIFGEHKETRESYPLDRVKLLPPTRPTTFWVTRRTSRTRRWPSTPSASSANRRGSGPGTRAPTASSGRTTRS
ncbi:MAG: DUF2437 domain-containing protein [Burkholderiales bacterium]|nr:DUF2437 domain-containing protein [Burkholderiales bacterium]